MLSRMRTSLSQNSDGESCSGGLPDPLPAPVSFVPGLLSPPSLPGAALPPSVVSLLLAAVSFAPAVPESS